MKVLRSDGVAYHTGPESCVAGREASGEALTGVRVGWPLSRERWSVRGAEAVVWAEGETLGCAEMRVPERPRVVGDPSMRVRSLYGNRAISGLTAE